MDEYINHIHVSVTDNTCMFDITFSPPLFLKGSIVVVNKFHHELYCLIAECMYNELDTCTCTHCILCMLLMYS